MALNETVIGTVGRTKDHENNSPFQLRAAWQQTLRESVQ